MYPPITQGSYQSHFQVQELVRASFEFIAKKATEEGIREANQYMEANPGVGVLAVEDGTVILVHNDDPGASTDVDLVIERMKRAAKADRWGRHGETVGLTLIIVDASRSGSFAWKIAGRRVRLAEIRALLEDAAARGELPRAMPRKS